MISLPILTPSRQEPALVGKCALGVMIKAPRIGQSKTRLTPPLEPAEAAELSRCFFRDSIANLVAVNTNDPFGVPVAIYTPAGSESEIAGLAAPGIFLLPQHPLTLGDRLARAADDLFSVGCAAVLLIGADSPTVPTAYFQEALAYLKAQPDGVVLGPTEDGGYYLIGLGCVRVSLFQGICWSTERVFAQTVAKARGCGMEPHALPRWYDVDDLATLVQLHRELTGVSTGQPGGAPAPHTLRCLLRLAGTGRFAGSPR